MTVTAAMLAGSLLAVALIALAVHWMGLGGDPRIREADHAQRLASEAIFGFHAVDIGLDRAGYGALMRDRDGRVMLLRRHGNKFAARLIDRSTVIRLDHQFLTVATSDRHFGTVTFDLGRDAQVWAASFRDLGH